MKSSVQQQIRKRMAALDIGKRELALRMGVHRTTLYQYLGQNAKLTTRTLERIARALECDLEILLKPLKGAK